MSQLVSESGQIGGENVVTRYRANLSKDTIDRHSHLGLGKNSLIEKRQGEKKHHKSHEKRRVFSPILHSLRAITFSYLSHLPVQ